MVNWYKNLYVGDTAKKKQKKWMRRIENKKAVPGVWLLTLPSNQQNNLDVIPADLLLQPALHFDYSGIRIFGKPYDISNTRRPKRWQKRTTHFRIL